MFFTFFFIIGQKGLFNNNFQEFFTNRETLLSDVFLKKSIPTPLQKRKDEYDKILQQWETNSLGLPVASGDVMMYRFLAESNTENWKSVFDDRAWVDMRVDPDRVTDDSDKDA